MSNQETKFTGELGEYQYQKTDDGSFTVYSEFFDEKCHSSAGAKQETLEHYVKGCKLTKQESPIILEVGFATGLGYTATLETLKKNRFIFHSMEIDEGLVKHTIANNHTGLIAKLEKIGSIYFAKDETHELRVYIGDARETIKQLNNNYYTAIYQDAFSPKKNPKLWTYQWFDELKRVASDECIMSTYSASKSIRKAMIKSGWKVRRGSSFGSKKDSTRATLTGESDQDILELLKRSPTPPMSD